MGAIGWIHDEWVGDFYPEGMPEDWLLAFYNSQFRCVYLPCEVWRDASDEVVAHWLQETREGFVFVLESPDDFMEEMQLANRFGDRGVLSARVELHWLEGELDLRNIAQRMQKAVMNGTSLYFVSSDASLTQLRQVKELMDVLGL